MPSYIALLRKTETSDYSVSFPDFPGCITAGETLEEARSLAVEALTGHTELMLEDGEELPTPSALDVVMANPEASDAVAFLVSLPDDPSRTVRVNITMDARTLAQIDAFAKAHRQTRSAFLVHAAQRVIQDGR